MMKDDNEDDLKNKEDLHIGGRHTALDIFRFAVFLGFKMTRYLDLYKKFKQNLSRKCSAWKDFRFNGSVTKVFVW